MTRTGRIAIFALGIAALSSPVAAQEGAPGMRGPGADGRGMSGPAALALQWSGDLQLTEAQVEELRNLRDGFQEQAEPLLARMRETREQVRDGEIARDEARERMLETRTALRELRRSQGDRVHDVLSAEQLVRFQERMHASRPGRGDGQPPRAGRRGAGRPGMAWPGEGRRPRRRPGG